MVWKMCRVIGSMIANGKIRQDRRRPLAADGERIRELVG